MQISKWLVPAAAAVLGCGFVAGSASADTLLYTSNGFEPSAGYVAFPNNTSLVGQPGGSDSWVDNSSGGASAEVGSFGAGNPANQQYVQVAGVGLNPSAGQAALFAPGTYATTAYNATNQQLAIRYSMSYSASNTNPFIGVTAFNGNDVLGRGGISGQTGQIVGLNLTTAGAAFTAAPLTYYQYEVLLDYATQTVSFYEAPADNVSPYVLMGTANFLKAATSFTDADLTVSTINTANASVTGVGYFDNYTISLVPEPTSMSILALGLLCGYRRQRSISSRA